MKSSKYIRSKLENRTNADRSWCEVDNNRYVYGLVFSDKIGWDWVYQQVSKSSEEVQTNLEPYELSTAQLGEFVLIVREVDRREGIDRDQHGLDSFED